MHAATITYPMCRSERTRVHGCVDIACNKLTKRHALAAATCGSPCAACGFRYSERQQQNTRQAHSTELTNSFVKTLHVTDYVSTFGTPGHHERVKDASHVLCRSARPAASIHDPRHLEDAAVVFAVDQVLLWAGAAVGACEGVPLHPPHLHARGTIDLCCTAHSLSAATSAQGGDTGYIWLKRILHTQSCMRAHPCCSHGAARSIRQQALRLQRQQPRRHYAPRALALMLQMHAACKRASTPTFHIVKHAWLGDTWQEASRTKTRLPCPEHKV